MAKANQKREKRAPVEVIASGWEAVKEKASAAGRPALNKLLKDDGQSVEIVFDREHEVAIVKTEYQGDTRERFLIPVIECKTNAPMSWYVNAGLALNVERYWKSTGAGEPFTVTRNGKRGALDTTYTLQPVNGEAALLAKPRPDADAPAGKARGKAPGKGVDVKA